MYIYQLFRFEKKQRHAELATGNTEQTVPMERTFTHKVDAAQSSKVDRDDVT